MVETPVSTPVSHQRGPGPLADAARRKDGRWEARYYVQTVNEPKRKVLYGKTRAEARDKLTKALSDRNVADAVKPPRPAPKEINALSADETRRLLEAAVGDPLEALYILAVHTGMRQGELLALTWQDVDLENAVVSVRRTLSRSGGRIIFGEPKTKKSRVGQSVSRRKL